MIGGEGVAPMEQNDQGGFVATKLMLLRSKCNLKNKVVNGLFKEWKQNRSDLEFSQKTFNEMWKERNNK